MTNSKSTYSKIFIFLVAGVAVLSVGITALATSEDDIVYPIAELGNCENEQACLAYCDAPENLDQCLDVAEQHNLLSEEELDRARQFQSIGSVGPGGCSSEQECEAYCENVNNIEECLAFAEQHGFMDPDDLEDAKKIAAALRAGAQLPGGCTSKASCEAYCEDINNIRECVAFAEAVGFMSPEELREVQQVLRALDAGIPLPGNCRGEEECDAYCEDFNHIEECVEFGIAAGFIPPEEADEVRRMIPLMREGKMPEACRGGREACEAYCSIETNIEECTTFFVEAGFMTAEEAEMFRKTGGKGPGGCSGQEECEAFCNNPANQQACFEFGTQHGFISEDELHDIKEGLAQFREGFESAPPEVRDCLNETIGSTVLDKIDSGTFLPDQEIGGKMRTCFEEFFSQEGSSGEFGPGQGGEFGAPAEDFSPEGFEPDHEGEFAPSDTGIFNIPSDSDAQDCKDRMIASLTGPPPPDFEQQIREKCFGSLIEQQIQQQIQEQTFSPPPSSSLLGSNFLGAIWEAMKPGLKRIIPFL